MSCYQQNLKKTLLQLTKCQPSLPTSGGPHDSLPKYKKRGCVHMTTRSNRALGEVFCSLFPIALYKQVVGTPAPPLSSGSRSLLKVADAWERIVGWRYVSLLIIRIQIAPYVSCALRVAKHSILPCNQTIPNRPFSFRIRTTGRVSYQTNGYAPRGRPCNRHFDNRGYFPTGRVISVICFF